MIKYAAPIMLLIFFFSCGEDTEEESIQITESPYYPLNEGDYQVYDIIDIAIYDDGKVRDTSIYQLREEVIEAYQTEENQSITIIDQYKRAPNNSSWSYEKRLTVQFINNQLIRTEDNIALVKLSLPLTDNAQWDPTSYFDSNIAIPIGSDEMDYYNNWEALYINIKDQQEVNGKNFNEVVSTQFIDYENRLEFGFGIESYAHNIGLISQRIEIYRTQCFDNCQNIEWDKKAETGHIYIKKIVESSNG